MQRSNEDDDRRTGEVSPKKLGLLVRARTRAKREYSLSLSVDTSHYAVAALGQSPYIPWATVFSSCRGSAALGVVDRHLRMEISVRGIPSWCWRNTAST